MIPSPGSPLALKVWFVSPPTSSHAHRCVLARGAHGDLDLHTHTTHVWHLHVYRFLTGSLEAAREYSVLLAPGFGHVT